MILVKIKYKNHSQNFFVIIKIFKIWQYYLKSVKHKVLIFINYKNLCQFIKNKKVSLR